MVAIWQSRLAMKCPCCYVLSHKHILLIVFYRSIVIMMEVSVNTLANSTLASLCAHQEKCVATRY